MTGNLFSGSIPDIVKLREMFDDPLQSWESTWTTDPTGMQSDGDVG